MVALVIAMAVIFFRALATVRTVVIVREALLALMRFALATLMLFALFAVVRGALSITV